MKFKKSFSYFETKRFGILRHFLVLLTFLTLSLVSRATNYYFSSSTGNDSYTSVQAQNQATPWKSISKLNSFFSSLVAGDVIYFKRGDTFYGSIVATRSGSSSAPITLTAYGTGNRPIISGLTTVSSWTSLGNNIYQSNIASATTTFNLVLINGIPQQIGRYPNNSKTTDPYLYYESFNSAGGSITDNELTSSTNWTGAEVVIRKKRWVMDRCKITNHSGGTLTYTNPDTYVGLAGFGYFIQNDARTLDQFGEWYLNPTTKNLQIHFGTSSPTAYTIKVGSVDNLLNLGSNKYITVVDLAFEGANVSGLLAQNGSNITVQKCDFTQMGKDGILIQNTPNVLLENLNVNYILNNGINIGNELVANAVIRNCSIKNCGMIPGMGGNSDGTYRGLTVSVSSGSTVEYNIIDSIGYNALEFQGNDIYVRNNLINHFCCVKDDGGGIYTWANNGKTYTNRSIYSNIILNAIGVAYGTSGKTAEAKGIYLDVGAMNVDIHDNSMANMARTGMLLNNTVNIKLRANTVYNARFGVELVRLTNGALVRNIEMKKNIIFPKDASQNAFYYKNFYLNTPSAISIQQDVQAVGAIDSNYYATPSAVGFADQYSLNYSTNTAVTTALLALESWKTFSSKDAASKRPAKIPASYSVVRFEYNATTAAKTVALDSSYIGVDGTTYNGTITLQPYTAKILVSNGPVTGGTTPPATTLKATATVPAISCFGGNTTVTVTGSGGTTPYTGTGSFSVNAGKGSLKISVASPVAGASTLLYSTIGAVSSTKSYLLRFSTVGTTANGSLNAAIRQTNTPWTNITPTQTRTFGTARADHEFIFSAPATTAAASFIIAILQSSGTTYIDNIAFFEATSAGVPISNNLYSSGQFESSISGIITYSGTNNHVAALDLTSKISNTYYYPVKDATGAISTATALTTQPASALIATATAAKIGTSGTTTVVVSATGGTAPYTGTGSFANVKAGSYSYTVTDAKGCTSVATLTAARVATTNSVSIANQTVNSNSLALEATPLVINSYPNPTTTEFSLMVTGGSNEMINISVSSVDGRIVYKTQGTSNKKYMFGNTFMTGMYIIQVIQGNTILKAKVIKIK